MGKITPKRQRNDSRSTPLNNKRSSGVMSPIIPSNIAADLAVDDTEIDFFFEPSSDIHNVFGTFKVPAVPRKLSIVEEDTVDSGLGSVDALSSDISSSRFDCSPHSSADPTEGICNDASTVLFNLLGESENDDSLLTDEPLCKMPRMSLLDISKVSGIESSITGLESMESVWSTDFCNGTSKTVNQVVTESLNPTDRIQRPLPELELRKTGLALLDEDKERSTELANLQAELRSLIRDGSEQKPSLVTEMLIVDSERDAVTKNTKRISDAEKLVASKLASPVLLKASDKMDGLNSLLSTRATKRVPTKGLTLWSNLSSSSRNGAIELKILSQPEEQHRARYLTEGSRGAVKDRTGSGFPTVKLCGYNSPATLQVFIGTDQGKVQPHLFYQASKVCGKNSTPCTQRKIEGTTVLEIALTPDKDMTASCDCVGILKERNVDVEHRVTHFGGTKAGKKRSTRCRLVFRVSVDMPGGSTETLQVASDPILCTQPPGVPEICKKSLSECSVEGGEELFIIGKNFPKDTKVIFREVEQDQDTSRVLWEKVVEPDKEYLHPTHLVCRVPPYKSREVLRPVAVQLLVDSGGKNSEPHCFTYKPLQIAQAKNGVEEAILKNMVQSVSPQSIDDMPKGTTSMPTLIPLSGNVASNLDVPASHAQGSNLVSAVLIPTTGTTFVTPTQVQLPGTASITIIPGQLDGCAVTQSDGANSHSSSEVPPPHSSAADTMPRVKQESAMSQFLGDLQTFIEESAQQSQHPEVKDVPEQRSMPCSLTGGSLLGFSLPPPDYSRNGMPPPDCGMYSPQQWPADRGNLQFMDDVMRPNGSSPLKPIKQDRSESLCMSATSPSMPPAISNHNVQCFLPPTSRVVHNSVPMNSIGLDGPGAEFLSLGQVDHLMNSSSEYPSSLHGYVKEYDSMLQKAVERNMDHGLIGASAP